MTCNALCPPLPCTAPSPNPAGPSPRPFSASAFSASLPVRSLASCAWTYCCTGDSCCFSVCRHSCKQTHVHNTRSGLLECLHALHCLCYCCVKAAHAGVGSSTHCTAVVLRKGSTCRVRLGSQGPQLVSHRNCQVQRGSCCHAVLYVRTSMQRGMRAQRQTCTEQLQVRITGPFSTAQMLHRTMCGLERSNLVHSVLTSARAFSCCALL